MTDAPGAESAETPRKTYLWRGLVRQARLKPRSIVPSRSTRDTAPERAVRALLPWNRYDYPGKEKGAQQALGNRVSTWAIKRWCDGSRRMPAWACELLIAQLEERARGMLAAAQALRDEAGSDRRRRPSGFAVPGADGLDGRPKSGRRAVKPEREV